MREQEPCNRPDHRIRNVDGALIDASASADPLPSWNDGATKKSIIDFVEKVTKEGSSGFVPPAERIATFDNDGTLWASSRCISNCSLRSTA